MRWAQYRQSTAPGRQGRQTAQHCSGPVIFRPKSKASQTERAPQTTAVLADSIRPTRESCVRRVQERDETALASPRLA